MSTPVAPTTRKPRQRDAEATREAIEWLERAADAGHTGAMIHLGKL